VEHCFTASMTAHLISILSQLKRSSFSPRTQAQRRALHQLCYQLDSALLKEWRWCQMSNNSSTTWTHDW